MNKYIIKKHDREPQAVEFITGNITYTMYDDGAIYSSDGNDIPQELFLIEVRKLEF